MKPERKIDDHVQMLKEIFDDALSKPEKDNATEIFHYRDMKRAFLRFKILTEIADLNNKKILDFGCGNAVLFDYLKKHFQCDYYGWDISQKMVGAAQTRNPEGNYRTIDILKDDLSAFENYFDFVLISGLFNGKWDTSEQVHEKWIQETLLKLWPLCKKGMSVNFLTEFVDWEEDQFFYCKIAEIVSFVANNLSRWFTIRHDYQLYQFTLYIYKEGISP